MKIQETEWGYIEWIHQKEKSNPTQSMSIGRTVIYPHKQQVKHVHYGQEQMVYILKGEGLYSINGIKKRYTAGSVIYMEAGSQHETINDTDKLLCELLISNPVGYQMTESMDTIRNIAKTDNDTLYAIIENLKNQFIDALKMPVVIFDESWNIVYYTLYFPEFCRRHCKPEIQPQKCACMKGCLYSDKRNIKETICPMGLRTYTIPILYKQQLVGSIRGGFMLLSESKEQYRYEGLYDMPESAALSIQKLLMDLSTIIVNYCIFNDTRRELEQKEKVIQHSLKTGESLKQDLQMAQNTVTNLKINHHFLFNTLNSMAAMALQDGSERLYGSIIDLAELFRYTMKTDRQFVSFEEELAYLNNYLNLQKLRYRENLKIFFDLTDALMGVAIPFNSLQTIAENAFIHGFGKAIGTKNIWIETRVHENKAEIKISNNGAGISPIDLNRINKSLAESGHGLSMIYTKLKEAFDEQFKMYLFSEENKTGVILQIPITDLKEKPL